MDECEHCTVRGEIKECLATNCSLHESWMVRELGQLVTDAPKFFSPADFNGEKTVWIEKAKLFTS